MVARIREALEPFFVGPGGQRMTQDEISRQREIASALMQRGNPAFNNAGWLGAIGRGAEGLYSGWSDRQASQAEQTNATENQDMLSRVLGSFGGGTGDGSLGGSPATSTSMVTAPAPDIASARVAQAHGGAFDGDLRSGIISTAEAIGADPIDLATAISYETAGTFDPLKKGPTTQWGQHRGLIQFGEPQAAQHGVDWNDPLGSQLGPNGAVANYFRSSGFQPGMSGLDLYSTINAGAPGRYNRSDANNGGAPGNVRDKWENQMAGHRQKALSLIGDYAPGGAVAANEAMAGGDLAAQAVQNWAAQNYAPEGVTVAETPDQIMAAEQAMASPEFAAPPMAEPRMIQDVPVADIAASLTGANVNPDIPMMGGGGGGGFLPTQPQQQPQRQTGGFDPELIQLLSSPYTDSNTRQIAMSLLGQQMQQADPMRQMQLERGRLELEQMRNPQSEFDQRAAAARAYGLDPQSPAFQSFVLGGGLPSPASPQSAIAKLQSDLNSGLITPEQYALGTSKIGSNVNVTTNVGGENLTPGQKKIDESFADTYLQWQGGGYADSAKQLDQLNESLGIIENAARDGRNISGVIGTLPNAVQPFINPEGTVAREGVEEVVQRSLREILGAQFTEKEGERLIARAYNPALPPQENAKRVRRLIGQIQGMAESRQEMVDFFDENGTLRGYKGRRPVLSSLENIESEWEREDKREGRTMADEDVPEGIDPADWEYMTPEDRKRFQ